MASSSIPASRFCLFSTKLLCCFLAISKRKKKEKKGVNTITKNHQHKRPRHRKGKGNCLCKEKAEYGVYHSAFHESHLSVTPLNIIMTLNDLPLQLTRLCL